MIATSAAVSISVPQRAPTVPNDRLAHDETRELFAHTDWSQTSLGPPNSWPQSLHTIVNTVLNSRQPMIVLWGPELIQIYNKGYAWLLGHRHPAAMGQRTRECWREVWHLNAPLYDAVLREGREIHLEDALFPVERYGATEEAYFSISYGPLRDDDGMIRGVLVAITEITRKVLDQRRFRSLRALAAVTATAQTAAQVGAGAVQVLRASPDDMTFALLYGAARDLQADDSTWAPELLARFGTDAKLSPFLLHHWRQTVGDAGAFVELLDGDAAHASRPVRTAFVAPLRAAGRSDPLGLVILGCNPRTTRDEHYREYVTLIAAQLASGLENAVVFHRERRIADTLQRAALPLELSPIAGVRIDAVYETGSDEARIGGDWYDAFTLEDGRILVSIGDVCGSGVAAAAIMGGMRQMIRALAQISTDPSFILDAADRAFRLERRSLFVTAFIVIADLANSTITYASAGHPPPLLRHADGRLEALYRPELAIGLRGASSEPSASTAFPPGSSLVLYTDGLTEESHDFEIGERRLRHAISSAGFAAAEHPAAYLRDTVLQRRAMDDVAILVVGQAPR